MRANIPTVRRIAWSYTVLHLLLMLGLILLLWKVRFPDRRDLAMLYGALVYLAYSYGSKSILLKNQRRGVNLMKLGLFRESILEFQSSYLFFSKYAWIDKYRFLTMLDSSAVPYREMALCNIAYSYIQLDEKFKAQEYYQKALAEFSRSYIAKSGLEYIESGEGK